eukprot:gb/GFBE01028410.1/.p1 GENE.gb/GFBE01028410.1/~~gb/GFBE01028410.1/.p1  ORF type:complete len:937 (+),score=284.96 gb/GFBE01028410.1/:1-2811(+)
MQTVTPTKRCSGTGAMMSPLGSESPTRADSSSPAQVFDMAADSDDEGAVKPQKSGKSADSSPATRAGSVASIDFDASTAAPTSTTAQEAAARRASLDEADADDREEQEQIDAFDLEDWDSPVSMMRGQVVSPCRAARSFDSHQREVADAVRAELQVDLEALVHQAVDEIRSWVSEEIAFARQDFQEEMRSAEEQRRAQERSEVEDLKRRVEEQRQLLERLQEGSQMQQVQSDLKEHMRLIKRLQEDVPAQLAPTMLDGGRETKSSDRVAEARVVAEERKWRLRLENMETSLERHSESLDALTHKTNDLVERSSAREGDVQRGLAASQAAEQQIAEASRETMKLRDNAEKQAVQIKALEEKLCDQVTELQDKEASAAAAARELAANLEVVRQQVSDVAEQTCGHESIIKSHLLSIQALRTEVESGRAEACALKEQAEKHTGLLQCVEGRCDELCAQLAKSAAANLEERTEKLEKEASMAESELATVQECLEKHNDALESLDQRSQDLEGKASSQEVTSAAAMRCMEEKMTAAEKDIAKLLKSLVEHGDNASKISKKTEEDTQAALQAIRAVETKLSSSEKAASDAMQKVWKSIEEHGNDAEQNGKKASEDLQAVFEAIRDVEAQLSSSEKASLEAIRAVEKHLSCADEASSALCARLDVQEHSVERLDQDFNTLKEEICSAQDAMRQAGSQGIERLEARIAAAESERLAELKVVCDKVEHQQGEVQALSGQFRTQLRAVRQGFGRALDELKESVATTMGDKVAQDTLQEALATRDASLAHLTSKFGQLLSAEEGLNQRVSDLGRLAEAMGQRDARREKAVAQQLRRVETELAAKASMDELLNTNTALHNWVNETREALDRWLSRSLEQFRCEQGRTLQKHEGWVKNVAGWIEQVHVREQGLSHVILHIVEQGSPELTKLLEQGLKMPRMPSLQPPKT